MEGEMSSTALQLLLSFQTVQTERSRLYSQLSSGFKQYVSQSQQTRDEIGFRVLMDHVTRGFADCSRKVLSVESALKNPPVERTDLAALLRRVQEGEREKLQVTVSLQALRAAMALRAERRRMQEQEAVDKADRAAQAAVQGQTGSDALAAGHVHGGDAHADHTGHACCAHRHGAGVGDDDDEGVEEASEEECDAAVREALQRLDRCVAIINDALEEVRYEVAELRQEE